MDQGQTPLLATLVEHNQGCPLPFHVPGHKGGRMVRDDLLDLWGPSVFTYDVTEVGNFDDLHAPDGAIARAQELAAQAVGAAHTFFLTAGSTAGLLAALLAVSAPGDKVLVPRNAHRSVLAGMVLSGAQPVFIWPPLDCDMDVAGPLALETVEHALSRHPDARVMVLMHPTYFGCVGETQAIIALAKERGMCVVVDEAHGAHFPFSSHFPASSLTMGADVVVQSWHKTLGALTGGAMLHCTGRGKEMLGRIRAFLRMVHTSSPSYLTLVSLDVARSHAATAPQSRWRRVKEYYGQLRDILDGVTGVSVYPGVISAQDPIKLVVKTNDFSARALARELAKAHSIHPELATEDVCLLVLGAGDKDLLSASELGRSIHEAARQARRDNKRKGRFDASWLWERPSAVMKPRDAALSPSEWVPLSEASGRICAELVAMYPPGSAVLCPGEVLDVKTADVIGNMLAENYRFHGVGPPPEYRIAVVIKDRT